MKNIFIYIQNKSRYFVATFFVVIFMVVVGPAVYASFIQVKVNGFSSQPTGFGYGYGYGDSGYTYGYGYGFSYLPASDFNGYGYEGTDGNVINVSSVATQTSFTVTYDSNYLSKHRVYYSTDPLFGTYSNTSDTDFESGTSFNTTISGLDCNTLYYYTVASEDLGDNFYYIYPFFEVTTTSCSTSPSTSSGAAPLIPSVGSGSVKTEDQTYGGGCLPGDTFSPTTGVKCSSIQGTSQPFLRNLKKGDIHPDVKRLQAYLNDNNALLAKTGPGSPGNETTYFGNRTWRALIVFQKNKSISPMNGFFGPITRALVNKLLGY